MAEVVCLWLCFDPASSHTCACYDADACGAVFGSLPRALTAPQAPRRTTAPSSSGETPSRRQKVGAP